MTERPDEGLLPIRFRPLEAKDLEWLRKVGSTGINLDSLPPLNELMVTGSARIMGQRNPNNPVRAARRRFFETGLRWARTSHPLHDSYAMFLEECPALSPLDVAVDAIRLIDYLGHDPVDIISEDARILAHRASAIGRRLSQILPTEEEPRYF